MRCFLRGALSRHLGPKWRPVPTDAIFGPKVAAVIHSRHCERRAEMWRLDVPLLVCLVGTCRQAMAAPSPPLPDSTVLAPHSVTRDAGDITVLTSNSWLLPQGSAVASFFGANGPAQIVQHNWNKLRAPRFDTVMVRHVPVERPADDSGRHFGPRWRLSAPRKKKRTHSVHATDRRHSSAGGREYQPPLSDESGVAAGSHSRHLGPKWRL